MARRKSAFKSIFLGALGCILLVAIIVAAINVVIVSGRGYKDFYLVYDDVKITDSTDISLPYGSALSIDCVYDYSFLNDRTVTDYSTDIRLDMLKQKSLNFTVDGVVTSLDDIGDLSGAFSVMLSPNGFVLIFTKTSLKEVLQAVYPNKTVVVSELALDTLYFVLTVSSYDNYKQIKVYFSYNALVELPSHIIF